VDNIKVSRIHKNLLGLNEIIEDEHSEKSDKKGLVFGQTDSFFISSK
jgi:hypothetical protein